MGISCEINLFKHPDSEYKPGGKVNGVVKYVLSEETLFNRITVSLKGLGKLQVSQHIHTGKSSYVRTYDHDETYVDIDYVVQDDTKRIPTPAGSHEIPFSFILPENIPPNFKYNGSIDGYTVRCKISYYIRIKFERPGFLQMDKRFKTKIKVACTASPTLPTCPVSYVLVKKPFQPFWQKDKVMNIYGTLENSVLTPGGHVRISYKIENGTNLDITAVKIKLKEEITYKCLKTFNNLTKDHKLTSCKATPIKAGESETTELVLDIPMHVATLQHSNLLSRDYFVVIVAELPLLHRKAVLKMPIEIIDNNLTADNTEVVDDSPPSYSETMEECKKGDLD